MMVPEKIQFRSGRGKCKPPKRTVRVVVYTYGSGLCIVRGLLPIPLGTVRRNHHVFCSCRSFACSLQGAVDIDLQEAIQEHEDAQVNVDQATCMSLVL